MKKVLLVILIVASMVLFCSCKNQNKVGNRVTSGADVQFFDYAYVMLGDKLIAQGSVKQWRDYKNSDTVQVLIDDKYYLTHYTNIILCSSINNHVQFTEIVE